MIEQYVCWVGKGSLSLSCMMAAFNVTVLPDYGYKATSLIDPMQKKFRAKAFVDSDVVDRAGDLPGKEGSLNG